jgi:hypothetical protein
MKLLQSITLIVCLFSITTSCAQWGKGKKVKGNGNITTESRSTSEYDGISVAGPMDFKLVEGNEGDITIEGDSNLIEFIVTELRDGKLVIKVEEGINLRPTKTIVITIPYESINAVSLAGSGDVKNSGTIKADSFDVSLAGSGDIDLRISTNSVESSIAGSGNLTLNGTTTNLKTNIAGSGDFNGTSLNSVNVSVEIAGSGDANVFCDGDLRVRIAGSGDVTYSGNPKSKDTKVAGSGSVSN